MFVYSNLAISIDGKIATRSRVHFPLGTAADRRLMQALRARADAILMGAGTLRSYRAPLFVKGARQPLNVVVSSRLEGISPRWKFFTDRRAPKLLFVGPEAPASRIRHFESVAEIHKLKKATSRNPVSLQIIEALEKKGARNLLVEGGGGVMWDFIQGNRIDEMHVTLTPRVVGGSQSPTLVDGLGFEPSGVVNFRLKSCRRIANELYLVYAKTSRRGP